MREELLFCEKVHGVSLKFRVGFDLPQSGSRETVECNDMLRLYACSGSVDDQDGAWVLDVAYASETARLGQKVVSAIRVGVERG